MAEKKRTKERINLDRVRIAELALQAYTHQQIADIIKIETGTELSRRQITYDMGRVRKDWLKSQNDSFNLIQNRELARIDSLEAMLWNIVRETSGERTRAVIEKALRSSGEDSKEFELIINKITEYEEFHKPDPRYIAQILDCQKERRRILGVYAPKVKKEDHTFHIKGYVNVSPGDWPSNDDVIIEGEVVEPALGFGGK
jgi:vacuolar-type H+-ATPase subunit I/STV1